MMGCWFNRCLLALCLLLAQSQDVANSPESLLLLEQRNSLLANDTNKLQQAERNAERAAAKAWKAGNNITKKQANQQVVANDAAHWDAFEITLYTNCFTLFFCLVVFGIFQRRCAHVFKPRWTHGISSGMVPPVARSSGLSCLKWVRHSLSITNDHIFRHAGLDALALITVVELGLQLFVVFMVLNVSVLLFGFRRWSMSNICYGSPKLWGHFILATLMVFALMWLIHHHWYQFSKYRRRYLEQLVRAGDGSTKPSTLSVLAIHGRTVVATGLPDYMYHAKHPDQALYDFFHTLFPDQIDSCVLARDPGSELTRIMLARDAIRRRLESSLAVRRVCLSSDPVQAEPDYVAPVSLRSRCCCCCRYSVKQVNKLKEKVYDMEQSEAKQQEDDGGGSSGGNVNGTGTTTPVTDSVGIAAELVAIELELRQHLDTRQGNTGTDAFSELTGYVVFTSTAGRSIALQTLLTTPWDKMSTKNTTTYEELSPEECRQNAQAMQSAPNIALRPAPEPRDIVHENVGTRQYRCINGCPSVRVILLRLCNVALLFFWAAPVAVISSFTQLEALERRFPSLKPLVEHSVLKGYLSGFLPTLAIVIFMAVLPYIFSFLAKAEGMTRCVRGGLLFVFTCSCSMPVLKQGTNLKWPKSKKKQQSHFFPSPPFSFSFAGTATSKRPPRPVTSGFKSSTCCLSVRLPAAWRKPSTPSSNTPGPWSTCWAVPSPTRISFSRPTSCCWPFPFTPWN